MSASRTTTRVARFVVIIALSASTGACSQAASPTSLDPPQNPPPNSAIVGSSAWDTAYISSVDGEAVLFVEVIGAPPGPDDSPCTAYYIAHAFSETGQLIVVVTVAESLAAIAASVNTDAPGCSDAGFLHQVPVDVAEDIPLQQIRSAIDGVSREIKPIEHR